MYELLSDTENVKAHGWLAQNRFLGSTCFYIVSKQHRALFVFKNDIASRPEATIALPVRTSSISRNVHREVVSAAGCVQVSVRVSK